MAGAASGGQGPYAIVVEAVALVAIAARLLGMESRFGRRARLDLRFLAILLAWAILPAATLVAVSLVTPVYQDRYVTASVPGMAIALALLTAWAFNGIAVRWAVRSRVIVASAALAIAAVVLFFASSVPAAQLTYGEASKGCSAITGWPSSTQREGGASIWRSPSRRSWCGRMMGGLPTREPRPHKPHYSRAAGPAWPLTPPDEIGVRSPLIGAPVQQARTAPVLNCARLQAAVSTRGRVCRRQNVNSTVSSKPKREVRRVKDETATRRKQVVHLSGQLSNLRHEPRSLFDAL